MLYRVDVDQFFGLFNVTDQRETVRKLRSICNRTELSLRTKSDVRRYSCYCQFCLKAKCVKMLIVKETLNVFT